MVSNAAFINENSRHSMKYQKSLVMFHHSILSEKTKQNYDQNLERFRDYWKIKDFDSLLTIEPKKSQEMIEDYVISLKNRRLRGTGIRSMISAIQSFYVSNDIILNWKKIMKMLQDDRKIGNDKPYTREHLKILFSRFRMPRHRALLLFIASTGVRVGFVEELKLKHMIDMPYGCKLATIYADTKYEYTVFLTPEATDYLEKYLEDRKSRGKAIGQNDLVFPINPYSFSTYLVLQNKDLRGEKIDNRYPIACVHGIRKFFDTILKLNNDINPNVAEKLTGHSRTFRLDNVYFKPDNDSMFREFQKVIRDLTITDEYRLKQEIETKDQTIKQLETDKEQKIRDLEYKLTEVYAHLKNISLRI